MQNEVLGIARKGLLLLPLLLLLLLLLLSPYDFIVKDRIAHKMFCRLDGHASPSGRGKEVSSFVSASPLRPFLLTFP